MNILYINHYAGSLLHGMEYRPYYLAREWVRMGHRVRIVAASQSHVRTRQPEMDGARSDEAIDGIEYTWLSTPEYEGNGAKRAFNMFAFVWRLWRAVRKLVQEVKPDVVIASSTYPLDIYPARRIASVAGAKLIFEVHDLWPLSPIELGGISRHHPFMQLLQHAEDYAYRNADKVVSMLPKARDHMLARGMLPGKFVHIPNGIDVAEWADESQAIPDAHQEALAGLQQRGLFLVGYAGAHGVANALDTLLDAAELLHDVPVCFVLVGQGPERDSLIAQAKKRGLKKVVFLSAVPKSSIPGLLRQFDALYIGLQNQGLFRFGISPNKLMDYMMVGKPIIQAIAAGNDPVSDAGCGYAISPEHPEAIAKAVQKLMALSEEERVALGERGRLYVQEHHDYRVLARQFIEVAA